MDRLARRLAHSKRSVQMSYYWLSGSSYRPEERGKPRAGESPGGGSRAGKGGPGRALTEHVCRAVPGYEARIVSVARALLKEALTEVLAEAAAGRHEPVVAAAAAAGPGVGLREAAEHSAGHQSPVREDREHRRRRPPEEAGGPGSRRTRRPGAGSLLSRSRAAAGTLLKAARSRRRPFPTRGASHTLRRAHWSQSEVRTGGSSASARLGSRLQPPLPPPSSTPLACSGPRRQHRPLCGHASSPAHGRCLGPSPASSARCPTQPQRSSVRRGCGHNVSWEL